MNRSQFNNDNDVQQWRKEVEDFIRSNYIICPVVGLTTRLIYVFFNGNGYPIPDSSIDHVFKRPRSGRKPTANMCLAFNNMKQGPLLNFPDLPLKNYRLPHFNDAILTAIYFWIRSSDGPRPHGAAVHQMITRDTDLDYVHMIVNWFLRYCIGRGKYKVDATLFSQRNMWIFRDKFVEFVETVKISDDEDQEEAAPENPE